MCSYTWSAVSNTSQKCDAIPSVISEPSQDSLTHMRGFVGCKGVDRAEKWSDPLKAGQTKTQDVEESQVFTEVFRSTGPGRAGG